MGPVHFAILLSTLVAITACADEAGLVALYSFDEDADAVAVDASGNGNDGRILGGFGRVEGPYGRALQLDGTSGYVDCGARPSLDIGAGGSILVWCYPESLQGGLVNWSTGGGWADERLVLAVNTYGGALSLIACVADGRSFQQFRTFGEPPCGEWSHLAFTFDGSSARVYRDGVLNSSVSQSVRPDIAGVPLWIGRAQGLGIEFFDGMIDEVRLYSRAVSPDEVFAAYKREAEARGKDTSYFTKVKVEARAYPGPGRIVASLDARAMQPLPRAARLTADIRRPGADDPLVEAKARPVPASSTEEIIFDVQRLPPGRYAVNARVLGPGGDTVGEGSSAGITWEGQPPEFADVRILNNLAWELLNVRGGRSSIASPQAFTSPRDRWVLIRSTASLAEGATLRIAVDRDPTDEAAITHAGAGASTLEAMRYLSAGEHTVHIASEGKARLQQLVVRSIPMLQHAFYGANPHVHPYGPYDWAFLAKDVLPNITTMIGSAGPELEAWKASGRDWISIINVPKLSGTGEAAVEEAYEYWSAAPGFQNPLMDGIIVDEFGGGDAPEYDVYRKAVERIYAEPRFSGKAFMPYGGTFYGPDRSAEFARVAVEGGGYICWERYLPEQPDEWAAGDFIRRSITELMPRWEERFPDAASKMCIVLGYMSQPTESLNIDPSVNYKVYMDMQLRALATHPALFGLGGIQEYHSSYCDEENVRWAGRLYRHYAIEGNTEPLTRDPYELRHIDNPDFEDGTEGWSIREAEPGSVEVGKFSGYSWLEGRYPRTARGDTFLLMRRSAKGANSFSQEISDLKPGRLYSLKMITADYQDLLQEKSDKAQQAVSITLEGVDVLPGEENAFQFTFPNCYAHILGKFNAQYPYYMNYHWRVFRARGGKARLTVSDWVSDTEPGGPIGQELMYNFIEIQPYIGE